MIGPGTGGTSPDLVGCKDTWARRRNGLL